MPTPPETLTILCSGASLGAYVPGLLLARQLGQRGFATDCVLLENLYPDAKRDNLVKTRIAFHRNFSLARMAQKLTPHQDQGLDEAKLDQLLDRWGREGRRRFIVIYGFWMPVIARYQAHLGDAADLSLDLCHMDAVTSVSWRAYADDLPTARHIWFFDGQAGRLPWRLQVTDAEPLPYAARNGRFLIHGGGWGLGSYRQRVPELCAQGLRLDVTVYEPTDLDGRLPENRYFMIDPDWRPWRLDAAGRHRFPPFGEVAADGSIGFEHREDAPAVYALVRQSQAIISKPGGSTLVDSLSAATPVVLLEPYGEHEQRNGELWQALGFAIPYQDWADARFSAEVLSPLHENLLRARAQAPEYVAHYANATGWDK